jgi:DNA repair protein RecO (recombination protein O)
VIRSARTRTLSTRALLLRRVPYREADWVVECLSERVGKVALLARGARKSQRRFGGTLEPFHTLRLRFDERPERELGTLIEASLERPRQRLLLNLEAMQMGGRMLGWVRRACPLDTPEPRVWQLVQALLDRLDYAPAQARTSLAEGGLVLLDALGWGLDFDHCVVCTKPCAEGRTAWIDAGRGGLVCQRCGGGRLLLDGPMRSRLARAARGEWGVVENEDSEPTLQLVEAALLAHAGIG